MLVQFSFFTVLAMDKFGNGLPVAFILTEKEDARTLAPALEAFKETVRRRKADWSPSCFIVDDDKAEQNAIW